MDDHDEFEYFQNMKPGKTYVSGSFPDLSGRRLRIANKVVDGAPGLEFATVRDEIVVRETPSARFQIKAAFVEADRSFQTVTIQKFTSRWAPKQYFTLRPAEIAAFLNFLSNIKRIHFPSEGKINISDSELEELLLQPSQAKKLIADNQDLLAELARTEITRKDIVALGYRKEQLREFEKLLTDDNYFKSVLERHPKGRESVWQSYFERNPWIFGYGLSLIFFGPLNPQKLEQVVRGYSVLDRGKRVDALLKSNALMSTTCFVEIKHHKTDLLAPIEYRPGIWEPSRELTGAVAQVQGTVSAALEQWQPQEEVVDDEGNPTGERFFTTEPRSFVICGCLSEFQMRHGVNERKFRSFELYRRNLQRPEIVTFDELFQRAQLIVESEH